ncbi:MAG: Gfo/Idh/MocA family protein [Vicinamibacterales bacterium]
MSRQAEPLQVAVVGLGVGEQHAIAFARHPECRLAWVYDADAAQAAAVSARLGGVTIARGFDEILDDPRIDVVSIASPDHIHFAQVAAALTRGKHVFVEKPICQTVEQAIELKRRWAVHGGRVKLLSNLILRAAPLYTWLRDRIAAGELGEIYAFDGDYLYGRIHKITEGWRRDVEGYSVMEGGGIHLIDLLLWLTGERPVRVATRGNRIATRESAFRYDDFMAATFTAPSGLIARVTANFGCMHRHQHVLRVFGTRGTFIHDDAGPRLHASRDAAHEPTRIELASLAASKGDLIPGFVQAIREDRDTAADTQAVFDALSACAASDCALRRGTDVEIPYI